MTSTLNFRRRRVVFYFLLFAGTFLITLNSCKPKPHHEVRFHCLKYEKAALEKWLPAAKRTAGFFLQFYSTHAQRNDTSFGSISYPVDSTRQYLLPPDTLGIERDSTARSFKGNIVLGNNWIPRKDINSIFYKPDGTARDFDYVLLIPKLDKFNFRHIVYDLKVYKGKTEIPDIFLSGSESKPSPPALPDF
jgi:hypothetical protein